MRLFIVVGLAVVAAIAGCMVVPRSVGHDTVHALVGAIIVVAGVVSASFLIHARRHHSLAQGMAALARRGALAGETVELVPGLPSPVVAGLWSPRIFCGEDLPSRLDNEELEAVILHERHHQLDRAPLRIVAISALSLIVSRLASGRAWLERERARIEIAADRYALAAGAGRPAIASALLKLSAAPALVGAAGFATAADLRIQALLGEPTGLDRDPPRATALAALGLLIAVCLVAYFS